MTHRPYVHKPWKPGKKVRKTLDACARHWEERNRETIPQGIEWW